MTSSRAPRLAAFAALSFLLATTSLGCGSKDGRQLGSAEGANLIIHNTTGRRVAVYVGQSRQDAALAGRVGEIDPETTGYFRLHRNDNKVYVRKHGESFFFAKMSISLHHRSQYELTTAEMTKM